MAQLYAFEHLNYESDRVGCRIVNADIGSSQHALNVNAVTSIEIAAKKKKKGNC